LKRTIPSRDGSPNRQHHATRGARHHDPGEPCWFAWGVTLEGRKALLGLQLGSRESYEDWLDFGRDLLARGLKPPALLVADGAQVWVPSTRAARA
jgi:transposase-like protein